MREYEKLHTGETFKLSDFRHSRSYYLDVIMDLRNERVTGQYTLPEDGEPVELVLNVVHPLEPSPEQLYLIKRQEALSLINGGGKIM